ncbi:MAG: penicillin-binding transpeptidase domain-containing protein [Pseudomonadota bacterium]
MSRKSEKKADVVRRYRMRSSVLSMGFIVVAIVLVGAVAKLQVLDRDFLNRKADARHLRHAEIVAHRGAITDRDGEPLALSTPVDSIWANPKQLAPETDQLPRLAKALQTDADQLMRRINRNVSREFVYLRRHAKPDQVKRVAQLGLAGIDVLREYKRYYPAGEVVGHLVGLTDVDGVGQEGLELAFNHSLAGERGAKRVLRDRLGHVIEEVESIRPARHGENLASSIDLRLQYFAYRELKRAMHLHGAQSGSMVIVDVRTGEVLAMVNQPSYNPNDRDQWTGERNRNRAITDIMEPGSSIKPLIVAAALEHGVVSEDVIVDTSPGMIQVGAKPISDHHNLGKIDLTTLLSRSSNVGMTKVAMLMEPEQLWRSLSSFGFGALTSSGFPGESAGLLSHFSHWRPISQATISYGYGLSVTPLQLARAYAALGNGGVLKPISLLRQDAPVEGDRVLSAETTRAVLQMMEHVVLPGGTGTKAAIPGYRVAGKTGTSWKYAARGYSQDKYMSWFAGLVPASQPRLAAVVVVDEPTGSDYYGGDVAAPVFAEVMTEALRLLAFTPDDAPGLNTRLTAQVDTQ